MADRKWFSDALDALGELYERQVSVSLKRMYWDDLGEFANEELDQAISAHRRDKDRGRFFPKPADLLAKLPTKTPSHPDPDAAWAVALRSYDESACVLMTPEIFAARNLALAVWESGEKVGARMAFKAAYEQAISAAHGTPPKWELSAGHNPEQRAQAVRQAQAQGLITADRARQLMPPEHGESDPGVAQVAGLLVGKVTDLPAVTDTARRFREAVEAGISAAKAREAAQEALRAEAKARAEAKRAEGRHALQEALQALQQDRPMATPIPERVAS